jgi:hypothetical protein
MPAPISQRQHDHWMLWLGAERSPRWGFALHGWNGPMLTDLRSAMCCRIAQSEAP